MKAIAQLFYLLIEADTHIDANELQMGLRMAELEGFDVSSFESMVNGFSSSNMDQIYYECVSGLRELTEDDQTRFLAWMCLIANADGFMHANEWNMIYRIYHKELGLDRQAILDEQFKLKRKLSSSAVAA